MKINTRSPYHINVSTLAVLQIETATVVGTITTAGNATVTVTGALVTGTPLVVSVAVALDDTATQIAGKIRTAFNVSAITTSYTVSGEKTEVILTVKVAAANDTTLNIAVANDTCAGITANATSADTQVGNGALTSAKLELYVYTGTEITDRGAIDYTMKSTVFNSEVTFEISELVNDFLDITFDGTYTGQNVWVDYQITRTLLTVEQAPDTVVTLTGFNGLGYFNNGVNPQLSSKVLMSNTTFYNFEFQATSIPVQQDTLTKIEYLLGVVVVHYENITAVSTHDKVIRYANFDEAGTFDSILFTFTVGTETILIETIEEPKHTPYKLTFVNKFGALQDLWFFKRTNKTLSTTENKYKANILTSGTYSINNHQSRILNKQGNEKLTLNSGFYPEAHNEVFAQLFLSEKVWISFENQVLPINITSSSFSYQTQLNDKLINHTIDCEFAFDKINNIR